MPRYALLPCSVLLPTTYSVWFLPVSRQAWESSLNSLPQRLTRVNLSLFLRLGGLRRFLGKFFFVSNRSMRHESNIVLWKFRFALWVQLSRRFAGISCLQIIVASH